MTHSTTRLETERLILRDIILEDADAFMRFVTKPRFHQYTSSARKPEDIPPRIAEWVGRNTAMPRKHYIWTVLEKESGLVIGDIRLWQEKNSKGIELNGVMGVGYGLNPEYWNKGYMTEALTAVTAFGHEVLKLHRIEGAAIAENEGSWRVMEKAGYQRESALRYRFYAHGRYWPLFYEYASVRTDLLPAG